MTTFGGFLPLEAGGSSACRYHAGQPVTTGRAAWNAILRAAKPRLVRIPFYICDAAIAPLRAGGIPFRFYAIDRTFQPAERITAADGELWLVVNYFGLLDAAMAATSHAHAGHVVIDDTQAFFRQGSAGQWSFNSARKFFGVPDGAYVYGLSTLSGLLPSDLGECDHLIARRDGDGSALALYRRHEERIGVEVRAMAEVSARLIESVDMAAMRDIRARNFDALQRRLGGRNRIEISLADSRSGPMCYPFLADRAVDRGLLANVGLFTPILWPELAGRQADGFAWEREIGCRLVPLPIDHRYTPRDMDTVADRLLQVIA